MGLLDKEIKTTYVEGIVALQDLHKAIEENLGSKYEVKFLKKGGLGHQMIGGQAFDQILVAKNAYHRTIISVSTMPQGPGQEKEETLINFNQATLKWWLQAINRNVGFIGGGIIRLMYGSNVSFDTDIVSALKSKYELKERKLNVGLSALWKKK